jgi:hypothetical protein
MVCVGTTVQQAGFWRDSAGQLRQLAWAPLNDSPGPGRLLELAAEYERLADNIDPPHEDSADVPFEDLQKVAERAAKILEHLKSLD